MQRFGNTEPAEIRFSPSISSRNDGLFYSFFLLLPETFFFSLSSFLTSVLLPFYCFFLHFLIVFLIHSSLSSFLDLNHKSNLQIDLFFFDCSSLLLVHLFFFIFFFLSSSSQFLHLAYRSKGYEPQDL
ncbi:hypothetical protein RchiOBHm_Chr5g0058691 [Rosa chinensis]|uniref:Transmembrane protein n=1 Tax=Rosa chinensis TaxID=74649 RepID=A0A2P6QH85_ROSCH|nr:hypothetical protein RchiOBHm_Chr5g0058691 [Rosa chinensis]